MLREELKGKHSGQLREHTPYEAHGETSRNSHSDFCGLAGAWQLGGGGYAVGSLVLIVVFPCFCCHYRAPGWHILWSHAMFWSLILCVCQAIPVSFLKHNQQIIQNLRCKFHASSCAPWRRWGLSCLGPRPSRFLQPVETSRVAWALGPVSTLRPFETLRMA